MSLFPETIARKLGGGKVECANLVMFDFASEPMRLWRGYDRLRTNDGAEWRSAGALGDVTGIEQAINGQAPRATFTLSGVDADVLRLARDEFESEVRGRLARVYMQFFGVDDPADPGNQRCLDLPYPIWAGRLQTPTFAFTEDGQRAVSIAAESIFALRSRPRFAMWTDRDQEARFPGDKGFEFVASMPGKIVTWPDY